jgi:lipopolysaccharide heptosyltransferase II
MKSVNPLANSQPLPLHSRVLVAQTGFLGDVVLTTPLLATLHQHLTPESLTVLTTPQAKPLVEYSPYVSQVLVDAKRVDGRGPLGLWRTAQRLRRGRFTLAIAAHKSLRTALLLALAGIPRRIGFRQSPGWFLYHRTAPRDSNRHEVERILCIMRVFGLEPEECDRRPRVEYSEPTKIHARTLLLANQITPTDPLFVVCPGSVWPTKRWTVDGFARLVQRLESSYGRVLLCGGPDDAEVANAVHEQAGRRGVNLVGQADLLTFMALIDHAQIVISNDSAPMHIAVARSVPVVAIFCATTPGLGYGPYTDNAVVVEKKELSCRPCGRHGSHSCPLGTNACMREIDVADVLTGVEQLLNRPSGMALQG